MRRGLQLLRRGEAVVSIINLASVAELENAVGAPVDPLRFRANSMSRLAGLARVRSGRTRDRHRPRARLKVVKRIVRCAATEVDPDTGSATCRSRGC